MNGLQHETWVNLLKLTGENITDAQLPTILKSLHVERLADLTESQATALIDALRPLPHLKAMLWEGLVDAIEDEQSKPGRRLLAKVDPAAAADIIVPRQMDKLARSLVRQTQQDLFEQERPQI